MKLEFLLQQLAAYPESQPVDAVKFLYQHAFGCGHLLPQETHCIQSIREELLHTAHSAAIPAFEPLGNGLCRLALGNPMVHALPAERIARMMRVTELQFHPDPALFLADLQMLRALARSQSGDVANTPVRLPFTSQALQAFLETGLQPDRLPPSHSQHYRETYHPAYRVVLRRFGEAVPILHALETQLAADGHATLVLDGDCGSGKTTLIALLAPLYDCNVLHMDDFFLPAAMRTEERLSQPGGNVHYERFREQVLMGLRSHTAFTYDAFDFHQNTICPVTVRPKPVTLIEGSYSLHPKLDPDYAALHAVRALLTVDPQEQMDRILRRNGEKLAERFRNEWIPLEFRYFQAYHKAREDEIILHSERHTEDEPPKGEPCP